MRAVDAYIDNMPEEHRELGHYIREQIIALVPGIEERFSFGMPFYHYYGMFLFIKHAPDGIHLTFSRGKDLLIAFPQLEQKSRAIMASVLVANMHDIERLSILELIVSAADWNREAKLLKIPMVKTKKKK